MRDSLFRKEVLQDGRNNWLGNAVLIQPLSIRLLTIGIVVMTLVAVFLICKIQYAQQVATPGLLLPIGGLIKVQTPRPGVVVARKVVEGQRVSAGDILFVITSDTQYSRNSERLGASEVLLSQLRLHERLINDDSSVTQALAEKERIDQLSTIKNIEDEIKTLDSEINLQTQRLGIKNDLYEGYRESHSQGFLSPLGLQQKYEDVLDQKARVQQLSRSKLNAVQKLNEARSRLGTIGERASLANSQLARQNLQVAVDRVTQELNYQILVIAPQSGVVAATLAEPGQQVGSQTLATIVPEHAQLEVQAMLFSADIGDIKQGNAVSLHFDTYPYAQYGAMDGTVRSVSAIALTKAEQANTELYANDNLREEGRFRVRIQLATQQFKSRETRLLLVPGMRLQVKFTKKKQTLLAWLLEPFNRSNN